MDLSCITPPGRDVFIAASAAQSPGLSLLPSDWSMYFETTQPVYTNNSPWQNSQYAALLVSTFHQACGRTWTCPILSRGAIHSVVPGAGGGRCLAFPELSVYRCPVSPAVREITRSNYRPVCSDDWWLAAAAGARICIEIVSRSPPGRLVGRRVAEEQLTGHLGALPITPHATAPVRRENHAVNRSSRWNPAVAYSGRCVVQGPA